MKRHKIAVIGFGLRGIGWVKHILNRKDTELIALCDVYEDRVQKIQKMREICS